METSATSTTYLGLWAHLQQPLATATGIYESRTTVSNKDPNPKGTILKQRTRLRRLEERTRQPQLTDNKEKA